MARSFVSLAVFVLLVAAVAAAGAQFRPGVWYQALRKPDWTPPNAAFGPVWTALYIMIAIAGWRVWLQAVGDTGSASRRRLALALWGVGLGLNALWSWLFFGNRLIGSALIDIALLWLTILAFIVIARPVSAAASWLFVPYLAWVSLATALNFSIWRANG